MSTDALDRLIADLRAEARRRGITPGKAVVLLSQIAGDGRAWVGGAESARRARLTDVLVRAGRRA